MSKRPDITYEPIPSTGPVAYSDKARAYLIIMRGQGKFIYQDCEIVDHPHPDYVITHREGGGSYCTSAEACNCTAGSFGRKCNHQRAVEYSGGVSNIKSAIKWWQEEFNAKQDNPCEHGSQAVEG